MIRVNRIPGGPLWRIKSSYFSRALITHAKAVPGVKVDPSDWSWHGYVDAIRAVCARLEHEGVGVENADDLPEPEAWKTARVGIPFATTGLRDYQVEGVRFLIARAEEGALLADSMRLGKSIQAITAARAFKKKTLVICPAHVVGVWGRPKDDVHGAGEIAKWWPDAWRGGLLAGVEGDLAERGEYPSTTDPGVVCLESVKPAKAQAVLERLAKGESKTRALGPAESRALDNARAELDAFADKIKHANVVVCHYDIAYAWVHVLLLWGFETIIFDELHICAGYMSRRAHALKALRAAARYTIGLTGTPVTNLPKHTHNVLEILAPLRFGYFFLPNKEDGTERPSYARLFCGSHQETVGVGEAQKTFWVHDRRSNLDVPDGKWAIVKEETLAARLKHLMLRRIKKDVDPQLPQKTRQVIDVAIPARCVIGMSEASLSKEFRTILNSAADGKLKDVVKLVAGHTDEREKVLCFCYRRLFAERVASDLKKKVSDDTLIMWVHGDLSQKERDKRIAALRSHDGPGVLCCTIDTTSTGIDLSFASVAVFAELTYEPHELAQAEERTYAYGKDAKVLIQYVIARGTGDELILRAVIDKLDTFEKLVGSTGDRMKEELAGSPDGGMKKLYAALVDMQKAEPGTGVKKRKVKGSRV